MVESDSETREALARLLDGEGWEADPVASYAMVAAILETAKDAGYLYQWAPSAAGGPVSGPLDHVLIDVWPIDPQTGEPIERGHLFANYAVTFARGLIAGDPRADITAFTADARAQR